MIELFLKDDQYPLGEINHTRTIARAFVLEEDKFLVLRLDREDRFGKARYIETSGGGVDKGETVEEALLRELDEELGVKVEILTKLGVVEDYYNLLSRKNINHYFLAKVVGHTKIHHVSEGDSLINGIEKMSKEELLNEYESFKGDNKIIKLVYQREYPIFVEALKFLK